MRGMALLVWLALHGQFGCGGVEHAQSTTNDLRYRLELEYRAEKPGDGAPTLYFTHHFENHSAETVYLSMHGKPFYLRSIEPEDNFTIHTGLTHPNEYSGELPPATAEEVLVIAPGKTGTFTDWRWVQALELHFDRPDEWARYDFRKPGRIRVIACYNSTRVDPASHAGLLPDGAQLWRGQLCAPEASVVVAKL